MRRGLHSRILFNTAGQMIGFSTGSDHVSEHEHGAEELISSLCNFKAVEKALVAKLKLQRRYIAAINPLIRLFGHLTGKYKPVKFPSIVEMKRVTKFPGTLQFFKKGKGATIEAYLGVSRHPLQNYDHALTFVTRASSEMDMNVAGAWDSRSFAIRVRGPEYVAMLEDFHQEMLKGQAVLGSAFIPRDPNGGGFAMALPNRFDAPNQERVALGQSLFESDMRLKAADESEEIITFIRSCLSDVRDNYPGPLKAIWDESRPGQVLYQMNPARGFNAEYGGPYTKDELISWGEAKCTYRLSPSRKPGSKVAA